LSIDGPIAQPRPGGPDQQDILDERPLELDRDLPSDLSSNSEVQQDHLQRMKQVSDTSKDYYDRIMAVRYPAYIDLLSKAGKDGKLLDVGVGFADKWSNDYVRPAGFTHYCADIAEEVVEYMARLLSSQGNEVYSKQGVLEHLPWESGTFDVVYGSHVLEHTTDINQAFAEIARILKPDGVLLFAVPCGYDDEPAHVHNREYEEWEQDFHDNGWEILLSGRFDFNNNEFFGVAVPSGSSLAVAGKLKEKPAGCTDESIVSRIRNMFVKRPTLGDVSSQLCTASQFCEDVYGFWLQEIAQEHLFHRKQWEYVYILQALQKYDLLRPGVAGLGFGCGKEPLPAVMVKHGCRITATDVEPHEDGDEHWGTKSLEDIFYPGICVEEVFKFMVTVRNVDMNRIPADLHDGFDFLWSCCALEHLGSLQAGIDFILDSIKCLKPGGVAVHTTEINLSDGEDTLETPGLSLYRRNNIDALAEQLEQIGCSLLPINWHAGDLPQDKHVDLPPYSKEPHLKLEIEKYTVTSLGLLITRNKVGG
jgi:SAM-dependent methyltransferase